MKKIKSFIVKFFSFLFNPHFLICFGLSWLITNGWSYILLGIGTYYEIGWMVAVSSAYLTFLWLPITPEKIVTVTISIFLLRKFFPKDEKTLAVLTELFHGTKQAIINKKEKRRKIKQNKKETKDE